MYKEKIVNIETGEETWRDFTPEETARIEDEKVKVILEDEKTAKQEAEAAAKKAAAEAKLAALGLTADDLKALGLQRIILGDCA